MFYRPDGRSGWHSQNQQGMIVEDGDVISDASLKGWWDYA